MHILAISGSLRAGSTNTAVLDAARKLAPVGIEVALYPGLGDLPHFNADLDVDQPPDPVQEVRSMVGRADAILISSPEYAHGVPGSLKNLLDWLVASLEFPGKPVGLVNAAARAVHADAALREILTTMSARLIPEACITLPLVGKGMDGDLIAANPDLAGRLTAVLRALAAGAESGAPAR